MVCVARGFRAGAFCAGSCLVRPVSGVARHVHWGAHVVAAEAVRRVRGCVGEPGVVERHYRSLLKTGFFIQSIYVESIFRSDNTKRLDTPDVHGAAGSALQTTHLTLYILMFTVALILRMICAQAE